MGFRVCLLAHQGRGVARFSLKGASAWAGLLKQGILP
jgi:hypothetical protein